MDEIDQIIAMTPEFQGMSKRDVAYGLKDVYFPDMPENEYFEQVGMSPHSGFRGVGEDIWSGAQKAWPKFKERRLVFDDPLARWNPFHEGRRGLIGLSL